MIRERGFTLIESLAVIFIIGVLASIMVISFSEIRDNLALNRAAHQVAQEIRRVQEMAMSPTKLDGTEICPLPLGNIYPQGYGIYFDRFGVNTDDTKYLLYADTEKEFNQYGTYTTEDCIIKIISLEEKNVHIERINNMIGDNQFVSINFTPPNPNTTIENLASEYDSVEIVFSLITDASKTRTVAINRAGTVTIK